MDKKLLFLGLGLAVGATALQAADDSFKTGPDSEGFYEYTLKTVNKAIPTTDELKAAYEASGGDRSQDEYGVWVKYLYDAEVGDAIRVYVSDLQAGANFNVGLAENNGYKFKWWDRHQDLQKEWRIPFASVMAEGTDYVEFVLEDEDIWGHNDSSAHAGGLFMPNGFWGAQHSGYMVKRLDNVFALAGNNHLCKVVKYTFRTKKNLDWNRAPEGGDHACYMGVSWSAANSMQLSAADFLNADPGSKIRLSYWIPDLHSGADIVIGVGTSLADATPLPSLTSENSAYDYYDVNTITAMFEAISKGTAKKKGVTSVDALPEGFAPELKNSVVHFVDPYDRGKNGTMDIILTQEDLDLIKANPDAKIIISGKAPMADCNIQSPEFVVNHIEKPEAEIDPVCTVDGQTVTGDGVISIGKGKTVTVTFNTTDDIKVYYKLEDYKESAEAPLHVQAGFSEYTEPIAISTSKVLSYYTNSAAKGDSNVKTMTFSVETGVNAVATDANEAEYFNLQGIRVEKPENGVFIRVANGKTTKVIL